MLLGTEPSFMYSDPQACAKARYAMDKIAKNYLSACWRVRQQKMGRFRMQYRDGRTRLIVNEAWQETVPVDETIGRVVSSMDRNRAGSGAHNRLIWDGGWKEWVIRDNTIEWQGVKHKHRRKYFKVWRGRTKGVFYKWRDCWRSIKGTVNPSFKGFDTLQEARNAD
jgi:hypothetical protein